jgi:hypothetical protein
MLILDFLRLRVIWLITPTLTEVLDPQLLQSTALPEEETLMAQKSLVAVSVLVQKKKATQQRMVNLIN